ncbi:MAG: ATP-binding protein [Clostridia bacterium]|nr:ATP-binding protein [Clostridia bacterium]
MSELKRNDKLVSRKFYQYLLPSIMMIFAMQFGSLLDGIIVGNFLGNDALSATAIVMPILYFIQLPGFALGIGGSIVVANLLGKRDILTAKKVFSLACIIGMAISFIFTIISFFVCRPIASAFSQDPVLLEYGYQYIFIYMVTDPVITFVLLMSSFMAVDNNPKLSSLTLIIGNVVKVALEVLFIKVFNMGMYGAAASTPVGYFIGAMTVFFYMKSKKRLLSFTFKLKGSQLKELLKASASNALNFALAAVEMLVINIFVARTITQDLDIIIFGLVSNMVFVFDLFAGGIQNIIPTLCGIFYGEKDHYSLKSITRKIYIINIAVTVFFTVFILALPNVYSIIFGYSGGTDTERVNFMLRIFVLAFIPYEINKFITNYYPSIDKPTVSIINVILKDLVIVLPVALSLLLTRGLEGYVISQVVTQAAAMIFTYVIILVYQVVKKKPLSIFMFEKTEFKTFDVSLNNELNNASEISKQLTDFALENNVPNRESQIVGLASEEVVNNIITYGYKKNNIQKYIDVNLKINEDTLVLTIRDDGLPFDPTQYEFDDNEEYSTSGIKLIKSLTDSMSYMRILNLNNTVFELKIKGE